MVIAYILITSKSGAEKNVAEALMLQDGIEEADVLYGEYDIIAKVKVEDVSQLSDFIMEKVRSIDGVQRTSTLIVASPSD